jgi:hypothetical protein
MMMQHLYSTMPTPKPPVVTIKNKTPGGKDWEEENPSDPDYIDRKKEHVAKLFEASIRLMILKSLEIVSLPPDILPFEEDTAWLEEMEYIGMDMRNASRTARWVEWVRYRVLVTGSDLEKFQDISNKLSSVDEKDVEATMETFRG